MARMFTVADLIARLDAPMTAIGPSAASVAEVRIIDDPEALRSLAPATAVVLTGAAAAEPWSVDMSVRIAWERAAACVVVTTGDAHTNATQALADRLSIALLVVQGAPLDIAVQIATIVAADQASVAGTLSSAARAFGTGPQRPARVLAALHRVLPAIRFALVDADGRLIAGADADEAVLEILVPFPHRARPARLRAFASRESRDDPAVEPVMRLAIAPLTAWAALRRLEDAKSAMVSAALLDELLSTEDQPGETSRSRMAALGWALDVPVRVLALLPPAGTDPSSFGSAVTHAVSGFASLSGTAPYGGGWVTLVDHTHVRSDAQMEKLIGQIRDVDQRLAHAAAGISDPVDPGARLRHALESAVAAARIARAGDQPLLFGAHIGPAAALPALLPAGSAEAAQAALAPMLAVDADGALLETLAATLDNSSRLSVVASMLGVHRNTVAARLERIRSIGIDITDPRQRLAIHIAARRLLDDGYQPAATP